jgi:two-component system response regulator AtoC
MLLEEHLVDAAAAPRVEAAPAPVNGRIATLDEVERDHIGRVWTLTKGHKGRTCQMLGISRPTLERKLKKYGIGNGAD